MIQTEKQLLDFLAQHQIPFERVEHPPVYTCQQADELRPDLQAVSTKNLFMQEGKNGRYYLLWTRCDKRLDLKSLKEHIGAATKLQFASADRLMEFLGVTPGAVTVLGLVNDERQQVELLLDEEIAGCDKFLCHPLVNTATLVLERVDMLRFLAICDHPPRLVHMP